MDEVGKNRFLPQQFSPSQATQARSQPRTTTRGGNNRRNHREQRYNRKKKKLQRRRRREKRNEREGCSTKFVVSHSEEKSIYRALRVDSFKAVKSPGKTHSKLGCCQPSLPGILGCWAARRATKSLGHGRVRGQLGRSCVWAARGRAGLVSGPQGGGPGGLHARAGSGPSGPRTTSGPSSCVSGPGEVGIGC
ncbi:hypothetical protein M9H77_21296 [Catharanthus roseus]|uniref:Uncharacterized protein n=1 Tax=Catharanthus roseus TaxID=4058 RepID=A0ACC0AR93_CATRO|nr:hypothetical protein M9H77_21296 [Catharanthus roseus]